MLLRIEGRERSGRATGPAGALSPGLHCENGREAEPGLGRAARTNRGLPRPSGLSGAAAHRAAHRDASDRRYFRILLRTARRSCWRCTRRRSTSTSCRSSTWRGCSKMPVPIPKILGHADESACWRCRIWATSRCRRISGAATPAEHAALYRQAVALIATLQKRGEQLASPEYLPYGISFDVEKLTWELEFFTKHFLEAYRGVLIDDGARGAARGVRRDGRRARRRAAGPLPSRLPQPQPDAAPGAALHHRLPGRAHGARHLRSGVAAARFLRRPARTDGERAARVFPGAEGRHGARTANSASGST